MSAAPATAAPAPVRAFPAIPTGPVADEKSNNNAGEKSNTRNANDAWKTPRAFSVGKFSVGPFKEWCFFY